VFQGLHAELASHLRAPEGLFKHWGISHTLTAADLCQYILIESLLQSTHLSETPTLSIKQSYPQHLLTVEARI